MTKRPRYEANLESLQMEGFISLEEIDPSCLFTSSRSKDGSNIERDETTECNKIVRKKEKIPSKRSSVSNIQKFGFSVEDLNTRSTVKDICSFKNDEFATSLLKKKTKSLPDDRSKSTRKFCVSSSNQLVSKSSSEIPGEQSLVDISSWEAYELHKMLMNGLQTLKFSHPTPIQERVLSEAIGNKRDILATAKTGSGKTLAYGLPILNRITSGRNESSERNCIFALILVPTRELGIQVATHLKQVGVFIPKLKIASVIGGLSIEKQNRELSINPDIIVATPGRLWELMDSTYNEGFLRSLEKLKFLVIDEADRMVESGHFKELDSILGKLYFSHPEASNVKNLSVHFQTFVFSATLSLQRETKRGNLIDPMKALLDRLIFRGNKTPTCINLIEETKTAIPETLGEFKISLPKQEKDLFLVYLLFRNQLQGQGKVLIFMNSIDGIRRLIPFLCNLGFAALCLHSQMQQKQRLKNLDRFRNDPHGILVCSDVAARGLDIPQVDTVIHFQLPTMPDLYIHRSGRTARANNSGTSIALIGEDDISSMKKITQHLHKAELSSFPGLNLNYVYQLKPLINLSRDIDRIEHSINKTKYENSWISESAEALGIEIDSKMSKNIEDEESLRRQLRQMKNQLNALKDGFIENMTRYKL